MAVGSIEPTSVAVYLLVGVLSMVIANYSYKGLLEATDWIFDLSADVDVQGSANTFFSLVALVYGFMTGVTFSICYGQQEALTKELYSEILTIEHLLQCTLVDVPEPLLRRKVTYAVRRYVHDELVKPHRKSVDSPFAFGTAYNDLVQAIGVVQDSGCSVTNLVAWSRKLTSAQSTKSSVMALVLPSMHWLFLMVMQVLFLLCFLVFDAASGIEANTITTERKFNFSCLVGLLVFVQLVLLDLNNPAGGLYSFQDRLDERLAFTYTLLDDLENREAGWVPSEIVLLHKLGLTTAGGGGN